MTDNAFSLTLLMLFLQRNMINSACRDEINKENSDCRTFREQPFFYRNSDFFEKDFTHSRPLFFVVLLERLKLSRLLDIRAALLRDWKSVQKYQKCCQSRFRSKAMGKAFLCLVPHCPPLSPYKPRHQVAKPGLDTFPTFQKVSQVRSQESLKSVSRQVNNA